MRTIEPGASVEDHGGGPEGGRRRDRRLLKVKARRSGRRGLWAIAGAVALVVLAAALVAADYAMNYGKVHRNVEVAGVPLGGRTLAEAEGALEERFEGTGEVRLVGGPDGGAEDLPAGELGAGLDIGRTAERAYAVGREGGVVGQLEERFRATFEPVRVRPAVEFRGAAARAGVEDLAGRLNEEPREAAVEVEGGEVRLAESREGYRLDVAATLANVEESVASLPERGEAGIVGETLKPSVTTADARGAFEQARDALSGDVVLAADGGEWTLSPEEVGEALVVERESGEVRVGMDAERLRPYLEEVSGALEQAPVDADVYEEGGELLVSEAQEGRSVDEEGVLAELGEGVLEGQRWFEVPVSVESPGISTADAQALLPTAVIGSYGTNYLAYDDSEGRVANLQIASGAMNGVILAPGEVFSAGDYLQGLDYQPAKIIKDGEVATEDGGGLCQVASTLYMAANYAGLDIIERHPHSKELPYIQSGFDATIYIRDGASKDLKFQNNTGGYLVIRQGVNTATGDVTAEIWGRPTGKQVEMTSEEVSENTWVTYRRVVQDGAVVADGVFSQDSYEF